MRRLASTDAVIVLLHWTCAAALVVSLLTGFRIAADHHEAVYTTMLSGVTLEGNVHWLHYVSSIGLTFVTFAYAAYLYAGRLAARFRLSNEGLRGTTRRGKEGWRLRNVVIYYMIFGLVGVLLFTGLTLYYDLVTPAFASTFVTIHLGAAWAILALMLLHIVAQYAYGAAGAPRGVAYLKDGALWLLKMVRPRFSEPARPRSMTVQVNAIAVLVAAGFAIAVGGGLLAFDQMGHSTLVIERIATDDAPTVDGDGSDEAWAKAQELAIHTREGANLIAGASTVQVAAVADADTVYFRFKWQDPTRSFKHLPLIKKSDGWHLLHEQYDIEDEDLFYEDKFAVLLSRSAEIGGGGATHMGAKPIADLPGGLSARGLHYTTDGSIADMWQWKAVRGQPAGYTDDNRFGPPAPPKPEELAGSLRYKGGYVTDPGKASYKNNFGHQGPGGFTAPLLPSRLPSDLAAMQATLAPMDLDPAASDSVPWFLTEAQSLPYSAEADAAIPVGTVIPGIILASNPWEGDRADLPSGATWEDGIWTLEIARRLDTGSREFDLAITEGEPLYLWVSVFDHTQTRHSRHMRPIRLLLPPVAAS